MVSDSFKLGFFRPNRGYFFLGDAFYLWAFMLKLVRLNISPWRKVTDQRRLSNSRPKSRQHLDPIFSIVYVCDSPYFQFLFWTSSDSHNPNTFRYIELSAIPRTNSFQLYPLGYDSGMFVSVNTLRQIGSVQIDSLPESSKKKNLRKDELLVSAR